MPDSPAKRLSLVPTPVGNLGDITLRALEVLRSADLVACEDTRHSRKLFMHFGINKTLERLDAHTMDRAEKLFARAQHLAFITDAGTPGLSDPGAELVQIALRLGVQTEVLPGPTALVPALVLSGLPVGRFVFHGFLPRSGRERRELLEEIAQAKLTSAIYESPHRLPETLRDLEAHCGPERACALVRELSKLHEETFRGDLRAAMAHFATGVRGELVLLIGPRSNDAALTAEERTVNFERQAADLAKQGLGARELRAALMAAGLERNAAYALALQVTRKQ